MVVWLCVCVFVCNLMYGFCMCVCVRVSVLVRSCVCVLACNMALVIGSPHYNTRTELNGKLQGLDYDFSTATQQLWKVTHVKKHGVRAVVFSSHQGIAAT